MLCEKQISASRLHSRKHVASLTRRRLKYVTRLPARHTPVKAFAVWNRLAPRNVVQLLRVFTASISVWLFAVVHYVGFRRYELTAWAEHICLSSYVCFSFRVVRITHSQRGGADTADCELSFSRANGAASCLNCSCSCCGHSSFADTRLHRSALGPRRARRPAS